MIALGILNLLTGILYYSFFFLGPRKSNWSLQLLYGLLLIAWFGFSAAFATVTTVWDYVNEKRTEPERNSGWVIYGCSVFGVVVAEFLIVKSIFS